MNNPMVVFGRVAPIDDSFTRDMVGSGTPKITSVKHVGVSTGTGFATRLVEALKPAIQALKPAPAPTPQDAEEELRKLMEQYAPVALPFVTPQTTTPMAVNTACNTCPTAPSTMPSVSTSQAMTAAQPAPAVAPAPKKAGFPWWMLLVAGGVAYSLRGKEKPAAGGLSGVGSKRRRKQSVSMSI